MKQGQPSELFIAAFNSGVGSIVEKCQCGAEHFYSHDEYRFEPGEIEALRERAKANPQWVQEHDYSNSTTVIVDGKVWVIDCHCNGQLVEIENTIWRTRRPLARYLKARAAAEHAATAADVEATKDL